MGKFDDDSAICSECIRDEALNGTVEAEGEKGECVLCGGPKPAITIKRLAEIVDPVFRENFQHGRMVREIGRGDDDTVYDVQQGEDLNASLQIVLGDAIDYDDNLYAAIISALIDGEDCDPSDRDEPFYDETLNYEETAATAFGPKLEWDAIGEELRTRRRFFSDRAKAFFDELFQEVEVLSGLANGEPEAGLENKKQKVVQEWPAGTVLCRARRAERQGDAQRFLANPHRELAPPPPGTARAGRMNPEGVSVFYGALDTDTCLAELRSSIGSTMVVGRFETKSPLRMLDFRLLERAWGYRPLSYFQDDFKVQVERREFLRRIHRLISQPVIPGHEADYLITQVLAEYLAHVRSPTFDGIVFASTQLEGGANIVVFPRGASTAVDLQELFAPEQFGVAYVKDSVEVYKTTRIEYTTEKLGFFETADGQIQIYGYYDPED